MLNKCVDEGKKIDIAQVPAVVKVAIERDCRLHHQENN